MLGSEILICLRGVAVKVLMSYRQLNMTPSSVYNLILQILNEPRREKINLRGFRPGPTQTGLYSYRSRLEAGNSRFRK